MPDTHYTISETIHVRVTELSYTTESVYNSIQEMVQSSEPAFYTQQAPTRFSSQVKINTYMGAVSAINTSTCTWVSAMV